MGTSIRCIGANRLMVTTLVIYCLLIVLASLLGGVIPVLVKLGHRGTHLALSLVSGVLLGVAILHMLPHALHGGADPHGVFLALLAGFLTLFLLERFFCFHHHETGGADADARSHSNHTMGWSGALVGVSVHTLIAGIALGSAVAAAGTAEGLAGFGVFLGVVLHKPFDALTITTLMQTGGSSRGKTLLVNGIFALVIPIGVLAFFLIDGITGYPEFTAWALAFSAGTFICIACADLLPELQFHQHDRFSLTGALFLGLAIAWGSGLLEGHAHDHGAHGSTPHLHDHDHHDHDHHDHDHHDHDHDHHDHDHHDHDHDHHDHDHDHAWSAHEGRETAC
jgi:zinc and cadmium transporter